MPVSLGDKMLVLSCVYQLRWAGACTEWKLSTLAPTSCSASLPRPKPPLLIGQAHPTSCYCGQPRAWLRRGLTQNRVALGSAHLSQKLWFPSCLDQRRDPTSADQFTAALRRALSSVFNPHTLKETHIPNTLPLGVQSFWGIHSPHAKALKMTYPSSLADIAIHWEKLFFLSENRHRITATAPLTRSSSLPTSLTHCQVHPFFHPHPSAACVNRLPSSIQEIPSS